MSVYKIIFFLLISTSLILAQESKTELLTRSCKLSFLSQEMTKSYVAACLKIDKKNQIKQIQYDALTFEDDLDELGVLLPTMIMQELLVNISEKWLNYKKVALGNYNKKNINDISSSNKELLESCQALKKELSQHIESRGIDRFVTTNSTDVQLLKILAEQVILTQSIASQYLTKAWAIEYTHNNLPFFKAITQYESNLILLLEATADEPNFLKIVNDNLLNWPKMESICTPKGLLKKSNHNALELLKICSILRHNNNQLMDDILMASLRLQAVSE